MLGAAAPWQNWRAAPRGALQWAQMGANADFALSEAPDRAQTPASEGAQVLDKLDAPGRLAQLGERQLDKLEVTGSSPVAPIVPRVCAKSRQTPPVPGNDRDSSARATTCGCQARPSSAPPCTFGSRKTSTRALFPTPRMVRHPFGIR